MSYLYKYFFNNLPGTRSAIPFKTKNKPRFTMKLTLKLVNLILLQVLFSCSSVYFDDIQTIHGREQNSFSNDLKGQWNTTNKELIELKDDRVTSASLDDNGDTLHFEEIILSDSIRFFRNGNLCVLNFRNHEQWKPMFIKIGRNGDLIIYPTIDYKLAIKKTTAHLNYIVLKEGGDTIFADNFNSNEDYDYEKVVLSGVLTKKEVYKILKRMKVYTVYKNDGTVLNNYRR